MTVVCAGAVVLRDHRVLLVRQADGHALQGHWTISWGRIAAGESPAAATVRETREEAGVAVAIEGVQELPAPWEGQIGTVHLCRHARGAPRPDAHETDAARYLSAAQIEALGEPVEPLSRWLSCRILQGNYTTVRRDRTNPFAPSVGFL